MPTRSISLEEPEPVALPPTDGGKDAWLLLAGCFVINVLIWGLYRRELGDQIIPLNSLQASLSHSECYKSITPV